MASPQLQQLADAASTPGGKLTVAWGGWSLAEGLHQIGINSWSDFAGMMAGLLSLAYLIDWAWKKWKSRRRPRK